jgi:hypothetical protein
VFSPLLQACNRRRPVASPRPGIKLAAFRHSRQCPISYLDRRPQRWSATAPSGRMESAKMSQVRAAALPRSGAGFGTVRVAGNPRGDADTTGDMDGRHRRSRSNRPGE